jgi:hypothetical protein
MDIGTYPATRPTALFPSVSATSFVLICMLFSSVGYGIDFSLTNREPFREGTTDGDGRYLLLQGEIVPGDYYRLIDFAISNHVDLPNYEVILSSPGGDVTEALKIGRLFKALYVTALVGPTFGPCVSACFIIFASATQRISWSGLIGIHRPYVNPERMLTLTPGVAEALETHALLDAENYLHQLRVPNHLVDTMFANSSTEVHWLSAEELQYELGERPPWYEEFLIARCGLDKEREDRTRTQPILEDTSSDWNLQQKKVYYCGVKLTHNEAKLAYARAIKEKSTVEAKQGGALRVDPDR